MSVSTEPRISLDVVWILAGYMKGVGDSLDALSRTSVNVRRACVSHMFRSICFVDGNRRHLSLEKYYSNLDEIKEYLPRVETFSLVTASSERSSSSGSTTVLFCTLYAIVKRLPRLREVDMGCFTWRSCPETHSCLGEIRPPRFDRIEVHDIKLVGEQDPLLVLGAATSVKELMMSKTIFPTAPMAVVNTTSIANATTRMLDAQPLTDSRLYRHKTTQRKILHYSDRATLAAEIESCTTLTGLSLVWPLSHVEQASGLNIQLDLNLAGCTALREVFFSVPARSSAYFSLECLFSTISSLPPSVAFLCIHLDVALRRDPNHTTQEFEDEIGSWSAIWQAVALKKTIKRVLVQTCQEEHSVSHFPLQKRNQEWELRLLACAEKTLLRLEHYGGLITRRIVYQRDE